MVNKVLEHNIRGQEGTFFYELHEKDIFHEKMFIEFCYSLIEISKNHDEYVKKKLEIVHILLYLNTKVTLHYRNRIRLHFLDKQKHYGGKIKNKRTLKINLINVTYWIQDVIYKIVKEDTLDLLDTFDVLELPKQFGSD